MENFTETAAEIWQKEQREGLEYEASCNKIRVGLEALDDRSGERAIWELVQNACDMSGEDGAKIKIELTNDAIIFSHHGKPFDYPSFYALVKQDSAKDKSDANLVGQYGTGFMTTHIFNRKVFVSGPFAVKSGKDKIDGYVQIENFELDRTNVDNADGPKTMKKQLDEINEFCKKDKSETIKDDTTKFRYPIDEYSAQDFSNQISKAIKLMPFVLIVNERLKEVEIYNHRSNEHFVFKKSDDFKTEDLEQEGWRLRTEKIMICDCNRFSPQGNCEYECRSIQSDKGDIVIIPPFPELCGDVKNIPSLFLCFPLLGTESFGVNFIFHSRRFYPVEKRNNIMLPGSTQMKREKGGKNGEVLKEMMGVLFSFYSIRENAKTLSREFCEVSFPQISEDEVTREFYSEMQGLWKSNVVNWNFLPVGGSYLSVSDSRVKLLHPDFYEKLNTEQRRKYEETLVKYALYPKQPNGESYLLPSVDLIAWSETVNRWGCGEDKFFLNVADVCCAIKNTSDDLHLFLMLMNENGNGNVMEKYPLLPNRKGDLRKKQDLCHSETITIEIFNLLEGVMGNAAKNLIDPSFVDVCSVKNYSNDELKSDIASTMGSWRSSTLKRYPPTDFEASQLDSLTRFCSASCMDDFNNRRGRIMPQIAEFYDKVFSKIPTIKFLERDEETFYESAFELLLDYTLYRISLKDSEWVREHKGWLKDFLLEYQPSISEERKKKLDEYRVLPNQLNTLCYKKDLRENDGVPKEMAEFYIRVFGDDKDLHKRWVADNFKDIVEFEKDQPKEIAKKIEEQIAEDMKKEGERKYDKVVLDIIWKIGDKVEGEKWKNWFDKIDDKKAIYIFNMKEGEAQKDLFELMVIDNSDLSRLAELTRTGNIKDLIRRMEEQRQLELNDRARFEHLHKIGKHIEDVLRDKIDSQLVQVKIPAGNESDKSVEDRQDGQDIVIQVQGPEGWEDVFYVEVKSKWDFNEPAHMSTNQVKRAVWHSGEYALCCVYLGEYRNCDLEALPEETIIANTVVKLDIGDKLSPMMKGILDAEKESDEKQIKIGEYRSNMSKTIFTEGEPFQTLIDKINEIVNQKINGNDNF